MLGAILRTTVVSAGLTSVTLASEGRTVNAVAGNWMVLVRGANIALTVVVSETDKFTTCHVEWYHFVSKEGIEMSLLSRKE